MWVQKNWVKINFESGLKNFWFQKIIGPNDLLGPNRFKPKKILGPKSLVKIGPITADISLVLTHQGEFSLVASIKVKFLASVTKNVVLSF